MTPDHLDFEEQFLPDSFRSGGLDGRCLAFREDDTEVKQEQEAPLFSENGFMEPQTGMCDKTAGEGECPYTNAEDCWTHGPGGIGGCQDHPDQHTAVNDRLFSDDDEYMLDTNASRVNADERSSRTWTCSECGVTEESGGSFQEMFDKGWKIEPAGPWELCPSHSNLAGEAQYPEGGEFNLFASRHTAEESTSDEATKCVLCGQVGVGPCGCGFQNEKQGSRRTADGIATELDGDMLLNDPDAHGRWWVKQFFPNDGQCPQCAQGTVEHVMGTNEAQCPGCQWRGTNQDAQAMLGAEASRRTAMWDVDGTELKAGDRVTHSSNPDAHGVVKSADEFGVDVLWDGESEPDIEEGMDLMKEGSRRTANALQTWTDTPLQERCNIICGPNDCKGYCSMTPEEFEAEAAAGGVAPHIDPIHPVNGGTGHSDSPDWLPGFGESQMASRRTAIGSDGPVQIGEKWSFYPDGRDNDFVETGVAVENTGLRVWFDETGDGQGDFAYNLTNITEMVSGGLAEKVASRRTAWEIYKVGDRVVSTNDGSVGVIKDVEMSSDGSAALRYQIRWDVEDSLLEEFPDLDNAMWFGAGTVRKEGARTAGAIVYEDLFGFNKGDQIEFAGSKGSDQFFPGTVDGFDVDPRGLPYMSIGGMMFFLEDVDAGEVRKASRRTAYGPETDDFGGWGSAVRVEDTGAGWQVFVWSDAAGYHIPQGQPHATEQAAIADANAFALSNNLTPGTNASRTAGWEDDWSAAEESSGQMAQERYKMWEGQANFSVGDRVSWSPGGGVSGTFEGKITGISNGSYDIEADDGTQTSVQIGDEWELTKMGARRTGQELDRAGNPIDPEGSYNEYGQKLNPDWGMVDGDDYDDDDITASRRTAGAYVIELGESDVGVLREDGGYERINSSSSQWDFWEEMKGTVDPAAWEHVNTYLKENPGYSPPAMASRRTAELQNVPPGIAVQEEGGKVTLLNEGTDLIPASPMASNVLFEGSAADAQAFIDQSFGYVFDMDDNRIAERTAGGEFSGFDSEEEADQYFDNAAGDAEEHNPFTDRGQGNPMLEGARTAQNWQPASGGSEQPFTTSTGHRVQYMHDTHTGDHAYIDLDTDMIIEDQYLDSYGLGANKPAGDTDPRILEFRERMERGGARKTAESRQYGEVTLTEGDNLDFGDGTFGVVRGFEGNAVLVVLDDESFMEYGFDGLARDIMEGGVKKTSGRSLRRDSTGRDPRREVRMESATGG